VSETRTADVRQVVYPPVVRQSPNRAVGYVVGGVYLLAGVVCAAVALGVRMAPGGAATGPAPARVVAYLLLGAFLVWAAARGFARQANTAAGTLYLVAGLGLLAFGGTDSPLLTLHHPDCVFYLGSAALLLGFGRTQG
jgi:hypothetical protein